MKDAKVADVAPVLYSQPMGRAHSRAQVVTGESFNAVIGARRGSTEAQSRRDREEEHERALLRARQRVLHEGALKEWQDAIVAANGEWRPVMDGLAVTYDNPSLQTDANAEKLIVSLIDEAQWHPRGLACAIERGDPEGWPGLTDPIFIALARYLKEARPADIVKAMECAQILVRECFVGGGRGLTPEYMARLGTVCEGIAHVIGLQPKVKGEVDAQEVALRAAQALRSAPTAAVTGTLHCWVEALTVRARESKLGEDERLALRRACEERKADPQYVAAFAELLPYLR